MLWRPMTEADLDGVLAVAAQVHPDYPEDRAVFDERRRLFPDGVRVLEDDGRIVGYGVSHPAVSGQPPRLNSLLGALPAHADCLHLHDVALLPQARGGGWPDRFLAHLRQVAQAAGLRGLALISVNGSSGYWERRGFALVPDQDKPTLRQILGSYDEAAIYMQDSCSHAGKGV